jgi:hypothetical protein
MNNNNTNNTWYQAAEYNAVYGQQVEVPGQVCKPPPPPLLLLSPPPPLRSPPSPPSSSSSSPPLLLSSSPTPHPLLTHSSRKRSPTSRQVPPAARQPAPPAPPSPRTAQRPPGGPAAQSGRGPGSRATAGSAWTAFGAHPRRCTARTTASLAACRVPIRVPVRPMSPAAGTTQYNPIGPAPGPSPSAAQIRHNAIYWSSCANREAKTRNYGLWALQALISRTWPSFFLCCWLSAHKQHIRRVFVRHDIRGG